MCKRDREREKEIERGGVCERERERVREGEIGANVRHSSKRERTFTYISGTQCARGPNTPPYVGRGASVGPRGGALCARLRPPSPLRAVPPSCDAFLFLFLQNSSRLAVDSVGRDIVRACGGAASSKPLL